MSLQARADSWATISDSPADQDAWRIRFFYALLAALCTIGPALKVAGAMFSDPDTQWHLKTGLDMLANRAFPVVDTYSYTFAGQPWIAKEWLGQILMAISYQAGGWNGVAMLMACAIGATTFAIAWFTSASIRPMVAFVVAIVMVVGLIPAMNARPYLLTFPLLVIWTASLFDAARKGKAPTFWLLILMCLWANIHSGFTLGFVIAGCAFLGFIASHRVSKPRELGLWVLFGVLTLGVTLIHPYGYKAILVTVWLANNNEAVPLISEWMPFDVKESPIHALILFGAFFALLISGVRFSVGVSLLAVFAFYSMFAHVRFLFLPFLAVPVAAAYEVAHQVPGIGTAGWVRDRRDAVEKFVSAHLPFVACGLGVALLAMLAVFSNRVTIEPDPEASATGAIAYAKSNGLNGNVLNSYNLGGALILNGFKTYIDGRTDQLFLDGFVLADHASKKGEGLDDILAKNNVEWAILAPKDGRVVLFDAKVGWKRMFTDDYAVVFVRSP